MYFAFSCRVPFYLLAQVTPGENSVLNYRLIGFSFPPQTGAVKYNIEIAAGSYNAEDDFQKNIVTNVDGKKNRLVAEVPSFGTQYTWRIVYTNNQSVATKSELHHFSTLMDRHIDPEKKTTAYIDPRSR